MQYSDEQVQAKHPAPTVEQARDKQTFGGEPRCSDRIGRDRGKIAKQTLKTEYRDDDPNLPGNIPPGDGLQFG